MRSTSPPGTPEGGPQESGSDLSFGLGFVTAFLGSFLGAALAWVEQDHYWLWVLIGLAAVWTFAGLLVLTSKLWSFGSGLIWGAGLAAVLWTLAPFVLVWLINPE